MVVLSYINIFVGNLQRIADFYASLFDLEEIAESRSKIFRGFRTGDASLGISALEAYELLALRRPEGAGERNVITFDVGSREEVDRLSRTVESLGGALIKQPFRTYYGWYQSVARDPEGNAFRVNFRGEETPV